jgi:hypothetical protein
MISELKTNGNPDSQPADPDQLMKSLEVELALKRAEWKKTGERSRSIRVSGFVFLFVLIVAAAMAFMFLISQVNEQRTNGAPKMNTSAPLRR